MDQGREGLPLQRFTILAASMIGAAVLAFLAAGIYDAKQAPAIVIADPMRDATIVVEVRGAVQNPGVYELPGDARVQQALAAAGGPTDDADLKTLNLARRVADADLIDVPVIESAKVPLVSAVESTAPPAVTADAEPDLIDLNTATARDLEALPGIGEVLSARIVDYRNAHGPFRSVDDLAAIDGISSKLVEKIRPLVTVRA
ncbi:MAG TPA: ComEA family DNA-binding protein [Thermomicrobiales bacterium]|nr:ComEA family DNA-binding protein [Thermomicrobiales bacterium]